MKSAILGHRRWKKFIFGVAVAEVYNNDVIVHGRALGLRYWQLPPAGVGVKEKASVKEDNPIVQLGYFH